MPYCLSWEAILLNVAAFDTEEVDESLCKGSIIVQYEHPLQKISRDAMAETSMLVFRHEINRTEVRIRLNPKVAEVCELIDANLGYFGLAKHVGKGIT